MARARGLPGLLRAALAFAALLAALSLVVWRQSRSLETLRDLDALRTERALAEAERADLLRRIQRLESRARVVAAARDRLGLHVPVGAEIVILPLASAAASDIQVGVSQRLTDTGRGGEAELGGAEYARRATTHDGGTQ